MNPVIFDASKEATDEAPVNVKVAEKSERVLPNILRRKTSNHALSTFMVRPTRVRLDVQDEDEEILLLLRRHVFTNIGWILVALVMILAPIILIKFPAVAVLPANFQFMTMVAWYLLTLGYIIESFLSWYFNVFIITDERVIDVDFVNLIYKNVATAKINRIEDVTVEMGGAVRSLFNFGTVLMQTAGEKNEFEFEDVPNPQEVSQFLNQMILEEEQEELEGRVR